MLLKEYSKGGPSRIRTYDQAYSGSVPIRQQIVPCTEEELWTWRIEARVIPRYIFGSFPHDQRLGAPADDSPRPTFPRQSLRGKCSTAQTVRVPTRVVIPGR